MPLKTLSAEENRLYNALSEIGEEERVIRPSVLERYPVLLRAPEVERRAGAGASKAQLARAATDALYEEIDNFLSKEDRLLAEAVLPADRDSGRRFKFEGERVKKRKNFLASRKSPICISENQYRRGRERVLKRIVKHLMPLDQGAPESQGPTVNFSTDPLVASLQSFSAKAAHLHYLCLASLFMSSVHDDLVKAGLINLDPPVVDDKPLFDPTVSLQSSHDLVVIYLACIYHEFPHPACTVSDSRTFSPPLSAEAAVSLVDRIITLRQLGPYDESTDSGEFKREIEEEFSVSTFKKWRDFNNTALTQPDSDAGNAFDQLVATSGEAAVLIGKHVPYHEPIFATARSRAHKCISSHYDFDEWRPLVNGQSLHRLAERYFDQYGIGLQY